MSQETMQLLILVLWNDWLLFPSKAERDARPECWHPWFDNEVHPDFQSPTEFFYDVILNGLRDNTSAIERAKRLGTYDQVDRTAQYSGPDRALPNILLEAVNVQGNHIRALQSETGKLRRDLMRVKIKHAVVVAVIAAVLARGPEIVRWVVRLFA
jgi:hypothetical protein